MQFETRKLAELLPAEYNPRKKLTPEDPEYIQIKKSIEEFGYADPIVINSDGTIIKGHQRCNVMMDLGYTEAEVIVLDIYDKAKEKALNIALNKITGEWDPSKLAQLIGEIDTSMLDATLTGFDASEIKKMVGTINTDWFENRERNDTGGQEGNDKYNEFLDKFEIKKTTDDCYTPDNVYDAVAGWVADEYGVERSDFIRPFFPGGDYQARKYRPEDIVVDNPPFSILAQIIRFYCEYGVRFFLFAPSLTILTATDHDLCYIASGSNITYENGANVSTGFITNMDKEYRFRTAPTLWERVNAANDRNLKEQHREIPKYLYPDNVIVPAVAMKWSRYGEDVRIRKEDCVIISELDAQKEKGKSIFGKGLLLSEKAAAEKAAAEKAAAEKAAAEKAAAEKAAAEKAAAEKAAAEKWLLSERELEIVRSLGGGGDGGR